MVEVIMVDTEVIMEGMVEEVIVEEEVIFIDLGEEDEEEDGIIKVGEDYLHGQVGIITLVNVREVVPLMVIAQFLDILLMIVYGLLIAIVVEKCIIEPKKRHYELKKRH